MSQVEVRQRSPVLGIEDEVDEGVSSARGISRDRDRHRVHPRHRTFLRDAVAEVLVGVGIFGRDPIVCSEEVAAVAVGDKDLALGYQVPIGVGVEGGDVVFGFLQQLYGFVQFRLVRRIE